MKQTNWTWIKAQLKHRREKRAFESTLTKDIESRDCKKLALQIYYLSKQVERLEAKLTSVSDHQTAEAITRSLKQRSLV